MTPNLKPNLRPQQAPSFLTGLSEIVQDYDAFVIDLWGVMHDGRKPYPEALEALKALQEHNKITFLLSNSPRRVHLSVDHLAEMGLKRELYTHIYTSGEDTHLALKYLTHPWHQALKRHFYHVGPQMHQAIYEELPFQKVSSPEEADFLLATGADFPNLSDYESILRKGIDRQLPMLCANPDRVVVQEGHIILCCGSIAERYEQLGGDVYYHGKPNKPIYDSVLAQLAPIPPTRLLAIGDSLTTDIQGGHLAGMDSLLIMGGIHHEDLLVQGTISPETPERLKSLTTKIGIEPTYAMQNLIF